MDCDFFASKHFFIWCFFTVIFNAVITGEVLLFYAMECIKK